MTPKERRVDARNKCSIVEYYIESTVVFVVLQITVITSNTHMVTFLNFKFAFQKISLKPFIGLNISKLVLLIQIIAIVFCKLHFHTHAFDPYPHKIKS